MPHPLLKRCTPDVERQDVIASRILHQGHDPSHQVGELGIVADHVGGVKSILQAANEGVGVVGELDGAHALL